MNSELKKLSRVIYVSMAVTATALLLLFWLFSRSFVAFRITPAQATFSVDNAQIGLTAAGMARSDLSPGIHTVKVSADGYIGQSFDVNFKRGFMKEVDISLKKLPTPETVSAGATLFAHGSGFNDGYYLGNNGTTIYQIKYGLDATSGKVNVTENKAITDARLSNISEIIWEPTHDLALLRKTDGSVNLFDFMKYDFVHQTETPWGTGVGSVAWAPDSSEIAYYYAPGTGERSLILTNFLNTAPTRVADLNDNNIENPLLRWSPDSQWLLVIPRNTDVAKNNIYLFNVYSRKFTQLTTNGGQVDAIFSPDGNKILYSTLNNDPNSPIPTVISIMDLNGKNQRALNLRAEISKIVWTSDSKNIVVSAFDNTAKAETIFEYDTTLDESTGFVLSNLSVAGGIRSINLSSDGKIVLYETADGIFAVNIN